MDVLKRALRTSAQAASLAVVVDAQNEGARQFYGRYGFLSFPDERKRLYLPMKIIEKLFPTNKGCSNSRGRDCPRGLDGPDTTLSHGRDVG